MAVSIPKSNSKNPVLTGKLLKTIEKTTENICFETTYANGDNRLYYGDNLDVLNTLCNDDAICGKINLIYIDPPYSTGGIFQTRDQKNAYTDTLLGNDYLDFMQKRLVLLHKLLHEQGSIYVHLDSKMVFHIKIMLDNIFGENNFQGMITRKKCKPKNYTKKTFGNVSDYILFYTKTENPTWNRPYDEWTDEKILKEYTCIEENTGRRYKKVPIHAPGVRNGETGKEWRGMMPPPGKHWQFTPKNLDELDSKGEIYWSSNGNPRRKVYLENSKGVPVQDIWLNFLDINNQNTQGTGYPTEKNPDLLRQIIQASSNEGDLILDCFAGSGTTLVAADDLDRKWIGIDASEEAIQTILNRFLNGISALGDFITKKEVNITTNLFENPSISIKKAHQSIKNFSFYTEKNNETTFDFKKFQ